LHGLDDALRAQERRADGGDYGAPSDRTSKADPVNKLFGKTRLHANFARLFRTGERPKAYLDEPIESQIIAGIVCFRGWVAGPNPISALTFQIGGRIKTISTFHERIDVIEATGARHAVGWRLYVHISSPPPGVDSLEVRILVGGVRIFARTFECIGGDRLQAALFYEPAERQIRAGIICFCGLIAGPDPISVLTLEIGDRSETVSTFYERTDILEATGSSHAVGWRHYVHVSSPGSGTDSVKIRILVGGISVFERTLICLPRSNARGAEPLLFCMHIPKTAGTSLRIALDGQPELIRVVCVYPDDPFISVTRCYELGAAAFTETDVVVGHFPYGFHAISNRPYRYISLVREPFAILRSYYLYAKHVQKVPYISRYSSIYEAAENAPVVEFDNMLTRHFANRLDREPISEADFMVAKENIRKGFIYIGTAEHMEESIYRIGRIIGIRIPQLHINKTLDTTISEEIDFDELRSRLESKVLFDLRLYEWISKQFGSP
jgi:hypothetical protein